MRVVVGDRWTTVRRWFEVVVAGPSLRTAALTRQFFESPLVRQPTPPDIGITLTHTIRDWVHASEVIFQVVSTTELFAVTAALAVHAFPILTGDLVNTLLMAFAVVGCSKALRPWAVAEAAVMNFQVLCYVLPVGKS